MRTTVGLHVWLTFPVTPHHELLSEAAHSDGLVGNHSRGNDRVPAIRQSELKQLLDFSGGWLLRGN
jgi:hypothetical protein